MNLFKVENYPKCDIKDKIILKLLDELRENNKDTSMSDADGWNFAFDLDLMRPIWTKQKFVTYYIPHSKDTSNEQM